jgi:8-oxo-dGTP diphosphatase
VQRRRDNAWVLPKGKLKPNEQPIAAAKREVTEETGHDVRVHEFLGVISYLGGSGPKIAHFWRMQALGSPAGELMDDIKAVEWLPLPAAIDRLSLSHEQLFLRQVGHRALKRTVRKAPTRPPAPETPPPVADEKPPVTIADAADAPPVTIADADAAPPPAKPEPRWSVLTRLTKRWYVALGRMDAPG